MNEENYRSDIGTPLPLDAYRWWQWTMSVIFQVASVYAWQRPVGSPSVAVGKIVDCYRQARAFVAAAPLLLMLQLPLREEGKLCLDFYDKGMNRRLDVGCEEERIS